MAERIFQVHVHGIVAFETHLSEDDRIEVEENSSLVTANIRSGSRPATSTVVPVNEADGTEGAPTAVTVMVPVGEGTGASGSPASVVGEGTVTPGPDLLVAPSDLTVEELKGLLRDQDLPVSGTKAELIGRLNSVEELKGFLREKSLPVSGTKDELITRLSEA